MIVALSSVIFAVVTDVITKEVRKEPPWILFAEEIVIASGRKR